MTQEPAPQIVVPPVNLSAQLVPGPDGKPWIQFSIQYGLAAATLVINSETATQLVEIVPKVLTEAATQARRANLGLILPGQVPPAHGLNGGRP